MIRRIARIRFYGVIAVLLLAANALALTALRREREAKTYTVTAYFTKAIGLFPKSEVRVLGVAVGEVRSVTPDGPRVKVVMDIQNEQKIPADARASIIPISLISDRYIQFFPTYESGPALPDKAVLDTDRTSIPVELDDLLASLQKFVDALEIGTRENPGAIGAAIGNAAKSLEGTGNDASKTLDSLGEISGAVLDESAQLDSLLVHFNQLLLALNERRAELGRVNTGLARSMGALAESQSDLDGTLQNLALLTQQIGSILRTHRPNLETDLRILKDTTQTVLNHQGSLVRSNDWLHVLADGLEEGHNGGALHTVGGITHVDVKDAHGGPCPFPAPLCTLVGLSGASETETQPEAAAPPSDPAQVAPAPVPTPRVGPTLPPLPSPPLLPSPPPLPGAGAAGDDTPAPVVRRPSAFARFQGWVLGVSESVYRFFEGLG